MQTASKLLLNCLALGVLAGSGRSALAQYRITTFDPAGSVFTVPYGMNDQGVVTGFYALPDNSTHGFVRSPDGAITTPAPPPGAFGTQLGGVNNAGVAAGAYADFTGLHGATYNLASGLWNTLPDIPGTAANIPVSITNSNLVVGEAVGGFSPMGLPAHVRGYTYNGAAYSYFDAPGVDLNFAGTVPEDINEAGTIVGFASLTGHGGGTSGFIRDASGTFTFLDIPGADDTFIEGINNQGVVAGSFDIGGFSTSFLLSPINGLSLFNIPGGFNTEIWGIDNAGNLVGNYIDVQTFAYHGFLATAVPEPGSTALISAFGLVGGGLAVLRNRKR